MLYSRNFLLVILIASLRWLQLSHAEKLPPPPPQSPPSKDLNNKSPKESDESLLRPISDSAFAKRQGMAVFDGEEDQLAMESHHNDQVAVESAPQRDQIAVESSRGQAQIPVPISLRGHPGQIVFPMPPQGFHHQQGPQQGQLLAMRPPPPNFQIPQQHHRQPTPQPQILSTPAGDLIIQKASEVDLRNQQRQFPQQQNVPRIVHNQLGGHQQQQRPHQHVSPSQQQGSSEVTKNIIRELFERKPPGLLKDGRLSGGYFGAPTPIPQIHNPKIINSIRPAANNIFLNKETALATNDLNAEGNSIHPRPFSREDASWPSGPDSDTPKIVSLEVKCEKSVMRVFVAFDKPFYGVIFSKGHYNNVNCIHLPAGLGHTSANFDIGIDSCGTQGNTENLYGGFSSGGGAYYENIIVVQYDSQVQEVFDQARKLRCTWHDQYEKSVTFRPFPVDQLDVVRADFAGDNVGCWMQIQVGKGPWASEVSGLVKIGQTMTMVLAIKDDDNKFDMMVRNCVAHDGQRAPIQLVDQWGCITRPKLMSGFTKIKNFGASATVLSYAHFQAFKFPDSMEVHFQCTIQICRHQCPEQCSQPTTGLNGPYGSVGKSGLPVEDDDTQEQDSNNARRRRRSANLTEEVFEYQTTFKADLSDDGNKEDVGLNRIITVVSPEDLENLREDTASGESSSGEDSVPIVESNAEIVCMSMMGFAAMITLLIGLLLVACIVSAVIVIRKGSRDKNIVSSRKHGF